MTHTFTSRPDAIQFYYKFYSYNGETTKVYAKLYDVNRNLIGQGELRITQSIDTYTQGRVGISYEQKQKRLILNWYLCRQMQLHRERRIFKEVKGRLMLVTVTHVM